MKVEDANCNKRRKNVNQYKLQFTKRNIETSKIKNVSWTRWKMQMRKQNNYQEMLYQHLKLQLLKNARIATKEFVKMSKRLGTQTRN